MTYLPMPCRKTPALRRFSVAAVALLALLAHASAGAALYYPSSFDPGFDGGLPIDDRFANVDTNEYKGQRMARDANGDVVVAGIVPAAGQSSGGNLGLVHYSSAGGRIAWSNPTASYASYFNIYLTWPNSNATAYTRVADLKILGNYIFALVDYAATQTNSNVYVIVFRDDGTYIGQYAAFTTTLDEHGVGLAPYSYDGGATLRLIAVANYTNGSGHSVVTLKRFSISSGVLTVDTSFGPYGNGANDILVPGTRCDSGAACDVKATALGAVSTDTASPRLYAAASVGTEYTGSGTAYHVAFLGIDGSNGNLLGGVGYQSSGIYYAADYIGDGPNPIAVTTQGSVGSDTIYLGANYSFCLVNSCGYWNSVLKVRAVGGLPPPLDGSLPDFNWGAGGTAQLLGGSIAALAADASQVMVVGSTSDLCGDPQSLSLYFCGTLSTTSFTVASGTSEGTAFLQPLRSGGLWSYFIPSDVIAGPSATSFTIAGSLGGVPPSDLAQFGTGQIVPDADGVFRSGFDLPLSNITPF